MNHRVTTAPANVPSRTPAAVARRTNNPSTKTANKGAANAPTVFLATANTSPNWPTKHASTIAIAPITTTITRATSISPASVFGRQAGTSRSRKSTISAVVIEWIPESTLDIVAAINAATSNPTTPAGNFSRTNRGNA